MRGLFRENGPCRYAQFLQAHCNCRHAKQHAPAGVPSCSRPVTKDHACAAPSIRGHEAGGLAPPPLVFLLFDFATDVPPGLGHFKDGVHPVQQTIASTRNQLAQMCKGWRDQSRSCALWTVEHQRVCSVGGKIRQLIFVVVIDC